ncbi:hypothetical protein I3760_03G084000 [Carya illinoinensis]|uniref:C2H2-type domain-containing protein n=1 Tax=Carya illinoinensis TaxID=32201 RepID=A0A8T1R156_CARIL|nr:uncharacterized protein LOC122303087 [Carya illinoinensis]KAG2715559.1 hypothetical protein I3760_03G084000 [Carya illinoinensis]KAG6660219.1 hypothetical protein CIPAW_03G090600 [Carya illinoinensis]KAG6720912.1 hypothetical protein I3842_03G086500 [Carya illinoinensis]
MDQDQEQRHLCKLCNKSFLSGRVLGGHMRCHMSKNPSKRLKKVIKSNMDLEGDDHAGYGLRENPKKSWKFSRSDKGTSGQEIVCKMCGKEFESLRALFGHMRHHSGRQRSRIHCKECGEGFASLRALTTHKKSHSERIEASVESWTSSSQQMELNNQSNSENLGLVRRKRSNRMRYKICPNSSFSSLNVSFSSKEIEPEVAEVAICLVMLSRGVTNWDVFCSVTESSDNDSVAFEVKSSGQTKRIANDDKGGIFVPCEVDNSFKTKKQRVNDSDSYASHSKVVLADKRVSEFCENDSGFGSAEEKKFGLEVPVDKFYRDAEYKMPKLDDVSGGEIEKDSHNEMKIKPTEVEWEEAFPEGDGLDPADSGFVKPGLSNKTRIDACDALLRGNSCKMSTSDAEILNNSWKKNQYKCKTCNKNFHSHQALGGHQSIHRPKNSSELKSQNCEKSSRGDTVTETEGSCKLINIECKENLVEQERSGGSLASYEFRETKEHKCDLCFKVFASGQALGGHKRAHSIKNSETTAEETVVIKQQISTICDLVDLNIPIILEEETNADVGIKSWWVGNDQKHELTVGLLPS